MSGSYRLRFQCDEKDNGTERPVALTAMSPGDSGVWFFICADIMMFAVFFCLFITSRAREVEVFGHSRRLLHSVFGLFDTVFLLTSSWLVVQAVNRARVGCREGTSRYLSLAILVGIGFAVSKIVEYTHEVLGGITLQTNDFFMYYYVFTGIHFLHFWGGIVALSIMLGKTRQDPLDARYVTWLESVASYWHMVDLLWVMLFPLLYLLRG